MSREEKKNGNTLGDPSVERVAGHPPDIPDTRGAS
jgi:hypothetical protein